MAQTNKLLYYYAIFKVAIREYAWGIFFSKFIGLSTPADGKSCLVKLAASYHV